MTIEPRRNSPEEEAYIQLLDEAGEELSWPAGALFTLAQDMAYGACMVHNFVYAEEDYEEAEVKMGFVAAELTDRDQELPERDRQGRHEEGAGATPSGPSTAWGRTA